MELLEVEVLQCDIDNSIPHECCPIYLALKRKFPFHYIWVGREYIYIGIIGAKLPPRARDFIHCIENEIEIPISPFTFCISVPHNMENQQEFNLNILRIFTEELLAYRDSAEIRNPDLLTIVKAYDHEEKFYHIELNILWRTPAWKNSEEVKKIKAEKSRITSEIADKRKEALQSIMRTLIKQGIDKQTAFPIALKILKERKVEVAKVFNIDLSTVPEFEGEVFSIIDGNTIYEL